MESLETAEKTIRLSFLIGTFKNVYKHWLKSFLIKLKLLLLY